jgi:transcription initiation factor TFIIH subunit 3
MDSVDGSDHYERSNNGIPLSEKLCLCANIQIEESPSLLTIVLDTNPHAWALLGPTLPLSKTIANILVFINAHLAFNNANQVAVIASHAHRAVWLYPRPSKTDRQNDDIDMTDGEAVKQSTVSNNANKYRPFAVIEDDIITSLRELISTTTSYDVTSTSSTQMAGALTLALSYINKASLAYSDTDSSANKPGNDGGDGSAQDAPSGLQSRIFVLSVSGDLAHQYIPIMNTTFAAQRLRIPIDILKLAGDTVFLQQASDATKGIYMEPRSPQGLLQYLMMAFLPDQKARAHLVAPTQEVVDFRAACFCHRNVVDVGFVCSICLSSMFMKLRGIFP